MGKVSLLSCSQQQTFLPFHPLCVAESSLEKGFDFQLPCSVYYPVLVVQAGNDEADEGITRIAKRNLHALGWTDGSTGGVLLDSFGKQRWMPKATGKPKSGATVEFWGFQSWGGLYGIRHAGDRWDSPVSLEQNNSGPMSWMILFPWAGWEALN